MSKFKVGDKVRKKDGTAFSSGGMVNEVGEWHFNWTQRNAIRLKETNTWIGSDHVELAHSNTLQVGETYTSANGDKWECIFIRDGKAWLVGVYSGGAEGSAYAFDIDGTASWASCAGDDGYNIKWGPKRETVTKYIDYVAGEFYNGNLMVSGDSLSITYDLIDGSPDWTTAKVTPCD